FTDRCRLRRVRSYVVSTRRFSSPGNFPASAPMSSVCVGEHRGEEVACRVVVAVVQDAAAGAHPGAVGEDEGTVDPAAAPARLRGREPAVGFPYAGAVPVGFVVELADELAEPGIRDRLGEPAVFDHALDVQGFHGDGG